MRGPSSDGLDRGHSRKPRQKYFTIPSTFKLTIISMPLACLNAPVYGRCVHALYPQTQSTILSCTGESYSAPALSFHHHDLRLGKSIKIRSARNRISPHRLKNQDIPYLK